MLGWISGDCLVSSLRINPCALLLRVAGIASGFLGSIAVDYLAGNLKNQEVKYAIELRNIVTSLGPAYIKLGQALSIRPDILSPAAMIELQKLCDKVLWLMEYFNSVNESLPMQYIRSLGSSTLFLRV